MENKAYMHSGHRKNFNLVIKLIYSEKHIFFYYEGK